MFQSIVEAVFHYAKVQPNRLCLADDTGAVTWREYADRAGRYAAVLRKEGITADGCVVAEACQTIDFLALQLALQLLGASFVPLEHHASSERIVSFIERTEAGMAVTCRKLSGSAKSLTWNELTERGKDIASLPAEHFPEGNEVCEILFSTGTTGKEKGVVLTHANDIAVAENVIHAVEMESDNVELILSPMNHSHGLRRYYANMVNGSMVVLLGSMMNMRRLMTNIEEYGVNAMDMVPSALSVLLKLSGGRLADYRHQLRYIQFGAAPMAEADRVRICELLPETRLYNFYGSTESGCVSIYNFNRPDVKQHCIGRPSCNAEIFMVDEERRPVVSSREQPGLLACRGGMNLIGYWRDEEETHKALADGVVYSNDIAYYDAEGDIILLGRRGDVINVGGVKVSPEEIEDVVRELSGIEDCGVVPVPDSLKGSVPKLYVQMARGETFDPAAIMASLAGRLEPAKRPAEIVRIEKIPRTFNGKLLRRELATLKE